MRMRSVFTEACTAWRFLCTCCSLHARYYLYRLQSRCALYIDSYFFIVKIRFIMQNYLFRCKYHTHLYSYDSPTHARFFWVFKNPAGSIDFPGSKVAYVLMQDIIYLRCQFQWFCVSRLIILIGNR